MIGFVYVSIVYTEFAWLWLPMPAWLPILSALLLGCVVVAGYDAEGAPVWKSSGFPLS